MIAKKQQARDMMIKAIREKTSMRIVNSRTRMEIVLLSKSGYIVSIDLRMNYAIISSFHELNISDKTGLKVETVREITKEVVNEMFNLKLCRVE